MTLELKPPLYPAEQTAAPTSFAVTGVTGYVAGPIVQRLLAAGHTVHGTVRNKNSALVKRLLELPGATDRLRIFEADLLQEGSFDEAFKGVTYVLHTASPFIMQVPKGKEKEMLLDPAVKGTENVLDACSRSSSVRRVVITSSVAAVHGDAWEKGEGHVFTADDWNSSSSETFQPYFYSKKLAEKAAWAKAQEQGGEEGAWSMVTVNPGLVMGPPVGDRVDSQSISIIHQMATGKMPAAIDVGMGICDVRDVAAAHILAALTPKAEGRYIVVTDSIKFLDIARTIKATHPNEGLKLPSFVMPNWLLKLLGPLLGVPRDMVMSRGKSARFDSSRAPKDLGITYTPLAETLGDMVTRMQQVGILPAPPTKR